MYRIISLLCSFSLQVFSSRKTAEITRRPILPYPPSQAGLTLVELIIAVAIVAVLAAIVIPYYRGYIAVSRYTVVMENLQVMSRELDAFRVLNNRYPADLAEVRLGDVKDPWGNPYRYLNVEEELSPAKKRKNRNLVPVNNDYDLYSNGPDGKTRPPFTAPVSQDDLVRANNGGFYGRVSDY